MTAQSLVKQLHDYPVSLARMLGYSLLEPGIHDDWIRKMTFPEEDITLQAHRDSYKTTCLIIAITILALIRPDLSILVLRKDQNSVVEVIRAVKQNLMQDPCQRIAHSIYGQSIKLVKDSGVEMQTNVVPNMGQKESQLMGDGIRSFGLTGKHFKRIFTDDIVTLKDRVSPAERENTKYIYQELQNIRTKSDSFIVNTGTCWHRDDCFTLMPKAQIYTCYDTGLLTDDMIKQKRSNMSASLFAANYELKHISDEDALFKNPQYGKYPMIDGVAHVDGAFGGDNTTALTIMCKDGNKRYGFGKVWKKHVQDCYDEIVSLLRVYRAGTLYTETNADKGYSAEDFKNKWPAVKSYHERMNKHHKISTYLKGEWDNIIWSDTTDPEYMTQILDYQEKQDPDDAPDSAASLLRATSNYSMKLTEKNTKNILGWS